MSSRPMNNCDQQSTVGAERAAHLRVEQRLRQKESDIRSADNRVSEIKQSIDSLESSKARRQVEYKAAERSKQALDSERHQSSRRADLGHTREEYVGEVMESDEKRKSVENEIRELSSNVKDMQERGNDAHKRLAIVRLVSMLDDLQAALQRKIDASGDDEEVRAQELLKAIQELSRDRENNLLLLSKKEREMNAIVDLKKKRLSELKEEAAQNVSLLREANDGQLASVAQRIQYERQMLLNEIDKLQESNEKLAEVVQVTKLSDTSATQNRSTALAADEAMVTSINPEEESRELRKRIEVANAERRRLELKTRGINERMDEDTEHYTRKMTQTKREVLFYQDECTKIEKENKELKMLCDSLALSLQN